MREPTRSQCWRAVSPFVSRWCPEIDDLGVVQVRLGRHQPHGGDR
jgi:hypothetical protein